ncbi:hypothetical protein C8Q80DRAFT_1188468 [Daedaleopsis nitida]|nr:hypothetical protein C8Q80DRAFT_1188468 [Daedaleopsis nitida]
MSLCNHRSKKKPLTEASPHNLILGGDCMNFESLTSQPTASGTLQQWFRLVFTVMDAKKNIKDFVEKPHLIVLHCSSMWLGGTDNMYRSCIYAPSIAIHLCALVPLPCKPGVMSDADEVASVISYSQSEFAVQISTISATALLVYDILLNLNEEVDLIWKRKLSVVSLLYVVTRYVEVVAYLPSFALLFPLGDQNVRCRSLSILEAVGATCPYLAWAAFSAFRIHALSNRNIALTGFVFLLNSTFLIPDIYQYFHMTFIDAPYPYNCLQILPPMLWSTRATTILGESIVLAWTLKVVYQTRASCGNVTRFSNLLHVLLDNGEAADYFLIPLVLNIASAALVVVIVRLYPHNRGHANAISSILISRFILALRSLGAEPHSRAGADMQDVTLSTHFPSNLTTAIFVVPELDAGAIERRADEVDFADEWRDGSGRDENSVDSELSSGSV